MHTIKTHTIKQTILIGAIILGLLYGVLPLVGFKTFDIFRGWYKVNVGIAIINILISFIFIIFIIKKNKDNIVVFNFKKIFSYEYMRQNSLQAMAIFIGGYLGAFPLLGIKTWSKSGEWLEIGSNYALLILLLSLLVLISSKEQTR